MGRRVGAEREHRLGGFGRDDRQLDRALRHAGLRLERVEIMADAGDIGRSIDLGDQERVETRLHHSREVVEREPAVERVDAHEERPGAFRLGLDQLATGRGRGFLF